MAPTDGTTLAVSKVDERPIMYVGTGERRRVLASSGATRYNLNNREQSTVKHTTADSWVCLLSTCGATYIAGHERWKGCEHTRVAVAECDRRGGDTITRAQLDNDDKTGLDDLANDLGAP